MHQLLVAIAISIGSLLPFGCNTDPVREAKTQESIEVVNNLPYAIYVAEPAEEAFRIVTQERGWVQEDIDKWVPFASAVMKRESGYCYNVRRGARMTGDGCELARQGSGSDSGFGQLISIHYKPGRWLCEQEGLCSADDIVSTPYASMTAFVALIERGGAQPWCYTAKLRRSSVCNLAP